MTVADTIQSGLIILKLTKKRSLNNIKFPTLKGHHQPDKCAWCAYDIVMIAIECLTSYVDLLQTHVEGQGNFPPNVEIKNEIKNKVVLNIYMYLHGTGLMTLCKQFIC